MKHPITPEQAHSYREDGYLILNQPIFSQEKFERLKRYSEDSFAAFAEKNGGNAPSLIDCPHWNDPSLFEWLFAEEMLSIVEPLIGQDIAIFACHFLQKPPKAGKRVPWHEDSAYWKGRLEPIEVASITISLEPSTTENGCLCVLPGTHRHGYSDYAPVPDPSKEIFGIEIRPEQYDESKSVDIVLAPNEASVHDGRIIHGSAPNLGALGRSAFTVRYFPTHVKFVPEKNPNFQIYLAQGTDHAGNPYSDPAKRYPPAGIIP